MKLFSTNLLCKKLFSLFLITFIGCCITFLASAQVTVPASNPNDSTDRQPLGCFYGYERTEALYLNSEINTTGYITQVGFYVNSLNAPALSTPVVIKMNTTITTTISASTYDSASLGATTVWSGNITASMLSENSWVTITLNTPFNYTADNLEVFVETNYGDFGGENWNSKGIRLSDTSFNCSQYWESDVSEPTDLGELNSFRPNIRLTFGTLCSGTPNPGNTLSDINPVCSGSSFTLSLQNISVGAGLTYQWQSSPNGSTWSNISGATNATLTKTQTTATYYECIVTCTNGGASDTSTSVHVTMQSFYHCYCASYAITTEDTKIDSVKIGTINTGSDPLQCQSYTDYTGGNVATLNPGQPSTIHIVNGSCTGYVFGAYVAVYIDMNHNTSFADANELVYSYGPINSLNGIPDGTFFIPVTALSGTTGMRIVLAEGISTPASCEIYTRGETEDYLVSISAVTACSGTPSPGLTYSTLTSVCPNEHFTLSIENYPSQTGISYQLQYSIDSSAWSSISGATFYTCVDSQTQARWYRCKLTCSNGGGIGYSVPVKITMKPFYECYCASYATEILSNDTKIDSVQFGTISSGSDPNHCESYTNYTDLVTDLPIGVGTTIHIVNGSCDQQFYESYVAVYIDYNGDGDYIDGNELAYSYHDTLGLNTIPFGTITPPLLADTGMTGMRVIIEEGDAVPSSCGLYQFGETEDYTVHIVEASTCQDPPEPGTTVAVPSSICSYALPYSISLSLNDNSSGTGQTYQWEQSVDGSIWTQIGGQTNPTATVTINQGSDTMYYRCQVHCGATTLPSTTAMVAVNPTPTGNTILDPIMVSSLPYTDFNDNLSSSCYTNEYTSDNAQASPDVFYTVTTSDFGYLEVSTCNTFNLNTVIHILDSNGDEKRFNDDIGFSCTGVEASDTVHTTSATETWFIVVEGQSSLEGSYQLDIDFVLGNNVNQISGAASEISLFPNPNNGTFNLSFDLKQNINDIASVSITNVIGQLIDEEKIAVVNGKLSKEISLTPSFSDGLYFVNVELNNISLHKRFVIQH